MAYDLDVITTVGAEVQMVYLGVAAFVLVVVGAAWLSARSGQRARGCCAPADPRDDLRMRSAYDDEPDAPHKARLTE